MPNPTFKKIETIEVGAGGSASIDFTSIPGTYTDLCVVWSVRNSQNSNTVTRIQFNGDTGSVYSSRLLYGNGSSALSYSESTTSLYAGNHPESSFTANTFGNNSAYIPNYLSTVAKSISVDGVSENNATSAWNQLSAHLWNPASNVAITSVKLYPASGLFVQYSSATLYGIKNS